MHWFIHGLIEILPIIVFFVVVQWYGFMSGVIALAISVTVLVLYAWVINGYLPWFAIGSSALAVIFSVATLITDDPFFVQFSDTLLTGLLGLVLLMSWYRKQSLLAHFFGRVFALQPVGWRMLDGRWGVFLLLTALGNEYVRLMHTPEVWAWYKLASTLAALLFGTYQFTLSARYRIPGASNRLGLRTR
jgi:intracellular septation protein A